MNHSLEVYKNGDLVFFSDEKWLHPLFELEIFLKNFHDAPHTLVVKDKIVGKAAALILVYLGIEEIHALRMSELAREFLQEQKKKFSYQKLIDRVACRTEDMLSRETSPEKGYLLVKQLRERAIKNN